MTNPERYFAASYRAARHRFFAACRTVDRTPVGYRNPGNGPGGELLFTDVVRLGPADAERVLIATSGTHGIEGFCGSGCQVGLMESGLLATRSADTAVVLVHAINPHGFAFERRVTETNVDLNRNFIDRSNGLPANPAYGEVHGWLFPKDWAGPDRAEADRAIADFIETRGALAFQAAVTGGQYSHPDGLFYGGAAPTWSNRTWRRIIAEHAASCRHLAFVDFHTGLGPRGVGELIGVGDPAGPSFALARQWWGAVTSPDDGSSSSAPVQGYLAQAFTGAVQAETLVTAALEYGTQPINDVLNALRGDNWLHLRGALGSPQGRAIKTAMRAAFYGEDAEWKSAVWQRAEDVIRSALDGLAKL